jgi:hypothetical protein
MNWEDILKKEISSKDLDQVVNLEILNISDFTHRKAGKLESLLQRKFNNDGIEVDLVEDDRCFYISLFNTDEWGDYDDEDKIATYKFDYDGNFSKV